MCNFISLKNVNLIIYDIDIKLKSKDKVPVLNTNGCKKVYLALAAKSVFTRSS